MDYDCRIFPYIDGIPTKGCWVDIDEDSTWESILIAMAEAEVFDFMLTGGEEDRDEAREEAAKQYGGDLLVSCTEGFAEHFLSKHDCFDLDEFVRWAQFLYENRQYDEETVVAFFNWMGNTSDTTDYFEEAYEGTYKDSEDWARSRMSDLYNIPENIENYIDYSKFVHDCEMDGYYFADVLRGVAVFRSH